MQRRARELVAPGRSGQARQAREAPIGPRPRQLHPRCVREGGARAAERRLLFFFGPARAALLQVARRERWAWLARRACDVSAAAARSAGEAAYAATPPGQRARRRVAVSRQSFGDLAATAFSDIASVGLLAASGVLRMGAKAEKVEVWLDDASMQTASMQQLLFLAERTVRLEADGGVQIIDANGRFLLILKLLPASSIAELTVSLQLRCGLAPGTYALWHLRRQLPEAGLLAELRVRPGSWVQVRPASVAETI